MSTRSMFPVDFVHICSQIAGLCYIKIVNKRGDANGTISCHIDTDMASPNRFSTHKCVAFVFMQTCNLCRLALRNTCKMMLTVRAIWLLLTEHATSNNFLADDNNNWRTPTTENQRIYPFTHAWKYGWPFMSQPLFNRPPIPYTAVHGTCYHNYGSNSGFGWLI